jgi:hypothetical protein
MTAEVRRPYVVDSWYQPMGWLVNNAKNADRAARNLHSPAQWSILESRMKNVSQVASGSYPVRLRRLPGPENKLPPWARILPGGCRSFRHAITEHASTHR